MELITASKSVSGPRPHRSLSVLIIGQVAFACILLIGAGLLTQTFRALENEPLGFNPSNLLEVGLKLPSLKYGNGKEDKLAAFYQKLLEKVSALPGVHAAAVDDDVPFSGWRAEEYFAVTGQPEPRHGEEPSEKRIVCHQTISGRWRFRFYAGEALDLTMFWVSRSLS